MPKTLQSTFALAGLALSAASMAGNPLEIPEITENQPSMSVDISASIDRSREDAQQQIIAALGEAATEEDIKQESETFPPVCVEVLRATPDTAYKITKYDDESLAFFKGSVRIRYVPHGTPGYESVNLR